MMLFLVFPSMLFLAALFFFLLNGRFHFVMAEGKQLW